MGIQESLDLLKRAQEMDREIYRVRHELASIPEIGHQVAQAFESEKSRTEELEA